MKIFLLALPFLCACAPSPHDYVKLFAENALYMADGFDFPVGPPNSKGYYNAQKFTENNHLGDDWNGTGGGNTDLGDPVHAIANGYITEARDEGAGWGNVVRIVHCWKENGQQKMVESLYAHLDTMVVKKGEWVLKGTKIGTIGNADGAYYAHLHFEIRTEVDKDLGGGYSSDTTGFVDPTRFINAYRNISK